MNQHTLRSRVMSEVQSLLKAGNSTMTGLACTKYKHKAIASSPCKALYQSACRILNDAI